MDIVLIISACHLAVVKEKLGEAKGRSVWSPRLCGSWVKFEGISNNKWQLLQTHPVWNRLWIYIVVDFHFNQIIFEYDFIDSVFIAGKLLIKY